ncbi:MAG: hypothetical protein ACI37Z_08640 [Candidatus Gastranaerophilaceae bacterium]
MNNKSIDEIIKEAGLKSEKLNKKNTNSSNNEDELNINKDHPENIEIDRDDR